MAKNFRTYWEILDPRLMIIQPLESTLCDKVSILGEIRKCHYAEYVHAKLGNDTFTFLAGHDTEDYYHPVGEK